MKRYYLSGPMSGLPDFNKPAFNSAAEKLRGLGLEVFNPAESPLPDTAAWRDHMRYDIIQLMQSDVVVQLPGWEDSKGAVVEYEIAQVLGMDWIELDELLRFPHARED